MNQTNLPFQWIGDAATLAFDSPTVRQYLRNFDQPLFAVRTTDGIGFTQEPTLTSTGGQAVTAFLPAIEQAQFGDPEFLAAYGVKAAYYAGAMANGIASAEMVIALGKAGYMGSFGSGGLSPAAIEQAIQKIQAALPNGPYLFNLLHNPYEPSLEMATVELYLRYGITAVEAAAYVLPSESLVYYRVMGLSRLPDGKVHIGNRVLAKISRQEVAQKFLSPAPERMLKRLLSNGKITEEQAEMARRVPLADDITAEADSGGHTDNRPSDGLVA